MCAALYPKAGRMAGLTGMALPRLNSVAPFLRGEPFSPSPPIDI